MNPLLVKTPNIVRRIYPNRIWSFPPAENKVYLTFDDGPTPEVTLWVLDLLHEHQAKATFFCVGKHIKRHVAILKKIIDEGHAIGNHTYDHLNGWKTDTEDYIMNCEKLDEFLKETFDDTSINLQRSSSIKLFRPPYGKITNKQSKLLQEREYKICMWTVLSGDFNNHISKEKCLQNVLKYTTPGSIIVFHDSLKAESTLKYVLPKVLDFISENGWECSVIT